MFTDRHIHSIWIGTELSILEQLTLKLYQRQKLIPVLWSFEEIKNVPTGVILEDANEILPHSSVFMFRNKKERSGVALWVDQFQLRLLQKYGGWFSQLDVACLGMPAPCEYYFCTHSASPDTLIDVCVMKTPKNAPFIASCLKDLEALVNKETITSIDWEDSLKLIGAHIRKGGLEKYIANSVEVSGEGWSWFMNNYSDPGPNTKFIHWWNGACANLKTQPKPGTFYYKLLLQEGLI